jgi:hypothetical protein
MSTPADRKRINDVFTNLYISKDEDEQDTAMGVATVTVPKTPWRSC